MKRRDFLKILGVAPAVVTVPAIAEQSKRWAGIDLGGEEKTVVVTRDSDGLVNAVDYIRGDYRNPVLTYAEAQKLKSETSRKMLDSAKMNTHPIAIYNYKTKKYDLI